MGSLSNYGDVKFINHIFNAAYVYAQPYLALYTNTTVTGVATSGVAGQFTCANTTLAVGDRLAITGAWGGAERQVEWLHSDPRSSAGWQ